MENNRPDYRLAEFFDLVVANVCNDLGLVGAHYSGATVVISDLLAEPFSLRVHESVSGLLEGIDQETLLNAVSHLSDDLSTELRESGALVNLNAHMAESVSSVDGSVSVGTAKVPAAPPPKYEYWISFFLPHDESQNALHALDTLLAEWSNRFDEKRAIGLYKRHAVGLVIASIRDKIGVKFLGVAAGVGLGWVARLLMRVL